jgi:hypothetical protein
LIIPKIGYLINNGNFIDLFRAKAQRSKDAKEDQEKSMLFWLLLGFLVSTQPTLSSLPKDTQGLSISTAGVNELQKFTVAQLTPDSSG